MMPLRLTLLLLGLWTSVPALAELAKPLHIVLDTPPVEAEGGGISQDFNISATEALMGGGVPERLKLHMRPPQNWPQPFIRASLIDQTLSPTVLMESRNRVLILVAARLKVGKGLVDQRAFKTLEQPLIEKHKGEVLISLKTTPDDNWPFDTFEVVAFPSLEYYMALMEDPAYGPDQPLGKAVMDIYTQDLRVSLGEVF